MSDVHSVGGYVTAGSLFALGLAGWQVLIALLVGIVIVQFFCNLVAKPSQIDRRAVPGDQPGDLRGPGREHPGHHPRAHRGGLVRRADLPRVESLNIIFLKFFPGLAPTRTWTQYGFLGLPPLGWICFAILWVAQAARVLARHGGDPQVHRLRGPAVYVVMVVLAIYLVSKAGWGEHRPQPRRGRATPASGVDPGDDRRDRARGVVLLRPDARTSATSPATAKSSRRSSGATSSGCRSTSCSSRC